MTVKKSKTLAIVAWAGAILLLTAPAVAQLIDKNKAPNIANEGIKKTLVQQIGPGAAIG